MGWPRRRRALPPSAMTMSMTASLAAEGCDQNRLDGVHPVFGLVEDDGVGAREHLVRHFHLADAEFPVDLLADLGLAVVEGRQTVHELHARVAGAVQQRLVDLIRREQLDALF